MLLALEEVENLDAGSDYRYYALEVLTRTSDGRRILVFQKILQELLPGDVDLVLQTVGNQYLLELGPYTLRHLRSPDGSVRQSAAAAIERLKFYAEAKKTFGGK